MNPSTLVLFPHSSGRSCRFADCDLLIQVADRRLLEREGGDGTAFRPWMLARFFLLCQQSGGRPFFPPFYDMSEANASRQIFNGRVSEWSSQIVCFSARLGLYVCGLSLRHWRGRDVEQDTFFDWVSRLGCQLSSSR